MLVGHVFMLLVQMIMWTLWFLLSRNKARTWKQRITTTTTGHRCIGESRNDHVTVAMYLAQAQCANVSARDKILAVRRNNPVVSQVLRI
mmetsp:Transcript_24626/g.36162  ORF Transcript_24626/g.36162 Transcript_24626/m.36162 type:complete len:89 (+) Transcript_24626:1354-1620(+)